MIEKFAEYKRAFQAFFISLLALFVGVSYFYRGKGAEKEHKYAKLSEEVDRFVRSKSFDEPLYSSVAGFLKNNPDARPGTEQKISQHLLSLGEVEKGLSLAKRSLKRSESHTPYYHEFAQATLLIEGNQYEAALEASLTLQEKLRYDEQLRDGSIMQRSSHLMASNMFRIAMLHRILEQHAQELAALASLKEFLGLSSGIEGALTADEQTRAAFVSEFSSPSYALLDYIHERERLSR